MKRKLINTLLLLFIPMAAFSLQWKIVPDKSNITFVATQNNVPVKGEFQSFSGTINFDPDKLSNAKVTIVIDMDSVKTSYKEVADTLKGSDWFNVSVFKKAIFTAENFKKLDNNKFQAIGKLQLRNITLPVTVNFNLQKYTKKQAVVIGDAQLKRTAFQVGLGEWKNTDTVKDDVTVHFAIEAQSNAM